MYQTFSNFPKLNKNFLNLETFVNILIIFTESSKSFAKFFLTLFKIYPKFRKNFLENSTKIFIKQFKFLFIIRNLFEISKKISRKFNENFYKTVEIFFHNYHKFYSKLPKNFLSIFFIKILQNFT